jgi:dipeptidyl aminopeptidase/acylaminoacyl peptidase
MATARSPHELIYGLMVAGDPQLSADGGSLVYTVTTIDETTHQASTQLWLSRRDGGELRKLTSTGTSNAQPRWSPDGESIAFTSDRDGGFGLFLLELRGGDPRLLAKHDNAISAAEWSPDGRKLVYTVVIDPEAPDGTERDPNLPLPIKVTERIDYKQDGKGFLGDKRAQVFVFDLADDSERQLTSDPADHLTPRWSPDGARIATAHTLMNGVEAQLEIIELSDGASRLIPEQVGAIGSFAWTANGSHLLLTADFEKSIQLDCYLIGATTGDLERVTNDFPATPDAANPLWLDERRALIPVMTKGRTGFYVVDTETNTATEESVWLTNHAGFSSDASGRYIAQVWDDFDRYSEIVILDRETGTTTQITELNTEFLAESTGITVERFDIERGDYTIESWLVKPADFDPAKRYPMIIDIHGGPNGWYGYSFTRLHHLLASLGMLVVYANPRGSGSYGGDFARQVLRDRGGEDYFDLMAVVDEAITRPYVDTERLGVYGYSYGGFMTSWIIGHTDRFKAAVIGAPTADLLSFYGTSDIAHTYGLIQFGGAPWENRDWYLAHSPTTHLHNAKTPALVLVAEGDQRCPIGQAESVYTILKRVGVESRFVRYPGESHGLPRNGHPVYRVDFLERVSSWFNERLNS